ncbi:Thiosulfate sulfurtransferase rhodanese domain-containing 2 [Hyphodiscus hymeniophilus]|uniref:Thiosulfate sulfurtransferase rhodanese domain-containing 2 n=1 Tax=Hyphodiscus hymeniophilus TaxID=353542 RepID=A0A9P6VQN5_9HELO|nr:Thiosulfate sulfurtransferase rhodanese domain-containing 2 [Hyphodiscus hymeniophilus]
MKQTWQPRGSSDPLSYTCTCSQPGQVLLFYRYFSSPPSLPSAFQHLASEPANLSTFHTNLTQSLGLKGKIRVAKEGFNITVGGSLDSISRYIEACTRHWSFAGVEGLESEQGRRALFKPSPGCACVFASAKSGDEEYEESTGANVRVCEEITPMGVSSYIPRDWDIVESLSPAEFHQRLCSRLGSDADGLEKENVLVDVRNHYESRIGYFVNPLTGEPALRPQVRRFGQWPQFVKAHLSFSPRLVKDVPPSNREDGKPDERITKGTQYMTYCTGGVRCEKGSRFLAENIALEGSSVCTLQGGIQAYLMWMDEEIKAGRKTPQDSLFKGKNYVFDARGSTGLTTSSNPGPGDANAEKVARCHMCGKAEDRLSKCRSQGCHLILVICEECEDGADPRCCRSCLELDTRAGGELVAGRAQSRPICECEMERELRLWGDKRVKSLRSQGKGRKKMKGEKFLESSADVPVDDINIRIKIFD